MSERKVGTVSTTPAMAAPAMRRASASTRALTSGSTRSANSTTSALSPAGRNLGRSAKCSAVVNRHLSPAVGFVTLYGSAIDSTMRPLAATAIFGKMRRRGIPMAQMVNLNADIAEGWGAYDIGNDADLMKVIKSASVACGFHAGDPNTMHRLCLLAKQEGVSVGVHPGFNDLWGFGRRRIQMKPQDLEYMVAYQIGALQAMASYAGLNVTHLKAHGALNNMAAE